MALGRLRQENSELKNSLGEVLTQSKEKSKERWREKGEGEKEREREGGGRKGEHTEKSCWLIPNNEN